MKIKKRSHFDLVLERRVRVRSLFHEVIRAIADELGLVGKGCDSLRDSYAALRLAMLLWNPLSAPSTVTIGF